MIATAVVLSALALVPAPQSFHWTGRKLSVEGYRLRVNGGKTEIEVGTKRVAISYRGWRCVYETDGTTVRTAMSAENRNGRYVRFEARGKEPLRVKIAVIQKD